MKPSMGFNKNPIFFYFFLLFLIFGLPSFAEDSNQYMTGLRPMTEAEKLWFKKHSIRINKVPLNDLGHERLNLTRTKESATLTLASEVSLPVKVDNSTLKYFPPIRNQGAQGSCASFSITYYLFTYCQSKYRDWDQKNTDMSIKFSPKWVFNFNNSGYWNGSSWAGAFHILMTHGCAFWEDFPYEGLTNPETDYLEWCDDPEIWRKALDYRAESYIPYIDNWDSKTDQFLQTVKELLVNGEIMVTHTFSGSLHFKAISDDPNTSEDDSEYGKQCVYLSNGESGSHSWTIVGYNDAIWTDINDNGAIDPGEKGALRIANSWGLNAANHDNGFTWVSYDAIRLISIVPNGPNPAGRTEAIRGNVCFFYVKENPAPRLLAEMTLSHAARNEISLGIGFENTPSVEEWNTLIFNTGAFAFDGTTTARPYTFVFDISSVVEDNFVDDSEEKNWFLRLGDLNPQNDITIESFKLIDVQGGGTEASASDLPQTFADQEKLFTINYQLGTSGTNYPPMVNAGDSITIYYPTTEVQLSGTFMDDGLPLGHQVTTQWNLDNGPAEAIISNPSILNPTVSFSVAGDYTFRLIADDTEKKAHDHVIIKVSSSVPEQSIGYADVFTGGPSTQPYRRAMPFTMHEDGTIRSISIYHQGGYGHMLLGVYDGSSSEPNNLLGVTLPTGLDSAAGFQKVPLRDPVYISQGTTFWLAWVFENNPGTPYQTNSSGRAQSTGTWSSGMPGSFGSSTIDNYIYNVFATYTPGGEPGPIDSDPPIPDPLTWAVAPTPTGPYSITMTATTATDENYGVQYFFKCLTDENHNSGWQDSPTYTDQGLLPETQYTYQVRARDTSPKQNEGQYSSEANATTPPPDENNVGNIQIYSTSTPTANRRAMPFVMPVNGTINSITMYHDGGSGGLLLGVYDGSSLPGTRLGVTEETQINSTEGWQTIPLIDPVQVTGGTTIWLAWVYENNPGIRYETGSPGRAHSGETWPGRMPEAFGSSTTGNYIYSIYASYTPEGTIIPPSISSPPQSLTVTEGESAIFTVSADGTEPLSYQWQQNGIDISGATSSSYTIPSCVEAHEGNYRVIVSNSAGSVTSTNAFLQVVPLVVAPQINMQPQSTAVMEGDQVTFCVEATGTEPLSYQWRKNSIDINGETSDCYTIASCSESDEGNYSVVVSNSAGSATSDNATLQVNPPIDRIEILGSFVEGTIHSAESGSNRVLILFVHTEDDNEDMNVSSVTYGGQPMTQITERNATSSGNNYRAFIGAYFLNEAGIAAANGNSFSVHWSSTPSRTYALASVFLGNVTNQENPIGTIVNNGGSSATLTAEGLTTNQDDMIFVAGICGNTGTYTVNNGFTEGIEVSPASADGVAGYKRATGATEEISLTHSNVNRQAIIGFAVNNE